MPNTVCLWAIAACVRRSNTLLGVMDILGGLYSSTVFMGISNCLTILPVINADRAVYYREKAAGMYAVFPYTLAQGLAEMPYLLAQGIVYSIMVYFMIQFEFTGARGRGAAPGVEGACSARARARRQRQRQRALGRLA